MKLADKAVRAPILLQVRRIQPLQILRHEQAVLADQLAMEPHFTTTELRSSHSDIPAGLIQLNAESRVQVFQQELPEPGRRQQVGVA